MDEPWIGDAVDKIEHALKDGIVASLDVYLDGEPAVALAEVTLQPGRTDIQLLGILVDAGLMTKVEYDENSRLRVWRGVG